MKKNFIIFFIFTFTIFFLNSRIVVQTGHIGSINSITFHVKYKVLFSSGEDGSVKIWNTETKDLLYNIQLSHLPIEKIVLNPEKTQFAALIKTSLTSSKIIVYDWSNDKQIFALDLNEVPLYLTFSSNGNYLLYLRSEWNSIFIYNATTGKKLPYLSEGFGIVSFIITFSEDKKILAYKPSGRVIYKEILTGNDLIQKPINTLENLQAISISSNTRFIAASLGKDLVIIDLLNGNKIASIEQPDILSTSIRMDGKEIICLAKKNNINQLVRFTFNGKELQRTSIDTNTNYLITDIYYLNENIFFATSSGEIYYLQGDSEISLFSKNTLLKISDISVANEMIVVGTQKNIIIASSEVLQNTVDNNYTLLPNQFQKPVGLIFREPNQLIIWDQGNRPNKFIVIDINSNELIMESEEFATSLIQLSIFNTGFFLLEQSGICRILDNQTLKPLFKYSTSGLNKILYITENILIAARNKIGAAGSSLLKINPQTGETVPIETSSLLCYDLVYDANRNSIYSIDISKENNKTFTSLKIHSNDGFEQEKTISVYEGEDLDASIVMDKKNQYLYSSIGYNTIEVYDGKNIKNFSGSNSMPRKLFIIDDNLISLNRNLSLTVWNRITYKKESDIFLFNTDDLNWIILFPDGKYHTSKNGKKFIKEIS